METLDVAIIGGGVSGTNTAWRLAMAGRSVALFERHPHFGAEASGLNAGGVRQQYRDPREIPLARLAVSLWPELARAAGVDLQYTQQGNLRVAVDEADRAEVERQARQDRECGLPVELLGPTEVRRVAPLEKILVAAYCPTDGVANPRQVSLACGDAALAAGAQAYLGVGVQRLEAGGGGWRLITGAGEWQARQVLVAAGPWSRNLLATVGVRLPLEFLKIHMARTERVAPVAAQFVSAVTYNRYWRQHADGSVIFGSNRWVTDTEPDHTSTLAAAQPLVDWWRPYCPPLAGVRLTSTWAGITDSSPDGIPVLGEVPGHPGLFVAAGFTGHGFALGPATGLVMSELMLGRRPPVDLAPFSLNRF